MKDEHYIKLLKKCSKEHAKTIKVVQQRVFIHSKVLDSIHSAIMNPDAFFIALSIYSSLKPRTPPPDDLAYVIALIIMCEPFLLDSSHGKKWLERFDKLYTNPLKDAPSLKDGTKDLYLKNIIRIKEHIWVSPLRNGDNTLYTILHNPNTFFKCLHEYASITKGRIGPGGRSERTGLGEHAKDNITSALVSLFIHNETFKRDHYELYERWVAGQKALRQPIEDKYLTNEPTNRQKDGFISYEDAVKIRNGLKDGSYERLLLTLYTDIPPVRSDFHDTKIYRSEPTEMSKDNFIILKRNKGTLVLNNYKTSKKHGTIKMDLPDETIRQLRLSLKKEPRDYLFLSTSTKLPYSQLKTPEKSFNSWSNITLKYIFDNDDFSLTMLRHSYISRKDLEMGKMTGTQRNEIAKKMAHSVATQERYRWFGRADLEDNLPDSK